MHCVMYAMLFVDTVNMKINMHNVLNSACYVVCQHCRCDMKTLVSVALTQHCLERNEV